MFDEEKRIQDELIKDFNDIIKKEIHKERDLEERMYRLNEMYCFLDEMYLMNKLISSGSSFKIDEELDEINLTFKYKFKADYVSMSRYNDLCELMESWAMEDLK